MYKKKKIEVKYIVLIALLFVALFLGFAVKIVNSDRKLSGFEKVIKDSVLCANRVLYAPINLISKEIIKAREKNDIYNKYKELLDKKEESNLIYSKNEELKRELKQMQELLDLNKTLSEDSYLNATVINRNLDSFSNTITIDKGENSGILKDMAVINKNGLVGRVIKTTNFNSVVKLITSDDINNKVSVKIDNKGKYIYGLLYSYNSNNKMLLIEGIDSNDNIEVDSIVTTTGLGNIFPSGILVGRVKNIIKDNFDLAKIVEVQSDVDFNDLAFVTILKRNDD